jgi:hypothetical protein
LFRNNQAASGGAVHLNCDVSSVSLSCFENNTGGAIRFAGVEATVYECLFVANTYINNGNSIENFLGTLTLQRSTFVENGDDIFTHDAAATTISDSFFCGSTVVDGDASTAGYIVPFGNEDLIDLGNQFFTDCTTCQGDVNGDGEIDLGDLFAVIIASAFGCEDCPEDLGGNGFVDTDDVLALIEMLNNRDRPCEVECPSD